MGIGYGFPPNEVFAKMTKELICQRCTACCRWPGYVKISQEEADRMAEHLEIDREEFMAKYTRLVYHPIGLCLRERPDYTCVFLVSNECVVHDAKPQQCRDFPNRWNFPGFEKVCMARPADDLELRPAAGATGGPAELEAGDGVE